mgnify:CR=1 FL=1
MKMHVLALGLMLSVLVVACGGRKAAQDTEGATPESYGELRRVAQSTIKTQLRAVFEKTGVHRQSDLMRLMMSIAH